VKEELVLPYTAYTHPGDAEAVHERSISDVDTDVAVRLVAGDICVAALASLLGTDDVPLYSATT
jgi:hypothetical protein